MFHLVRKITLLSDMFRYYTCGPCILRPPIQPEKYGLTLKVVLKGRDSYIANIRAVSLMVSLKIEVIVKWRGLKSQGGLYPKYISCCKVSYSFLDINSIQ